MRPKLIQHPTVFPFYLQIAHLPHKRKHFYPRQLVQRAKCGSLRERERKNYANAPNGENKTANRFLGLCTSAKFANSKQSPAVRGEKHGSAHRRRLSFSEKKFTVLRCRESPNVWLLPAATANPRSYTHPQVSRDVTRGGFERAGDGTRDVGRKEGAGGDTRGSYCIITCMLLFFFYFIKNVSAFFPFKNV